MFPSTYFDGTCDKQEKEEQDEFIKLVKNYLEMDMTKFLKNACMFKYKDLIVVMDNLLVIETNGYTQIITTST